jgi:hypothetical protein
MNMFLINIILKFKNRLHAEISSANMQGKTNFLVNLTFFFVVFQ